MRLYICPVKKKPDQVVYNETTDRYEAGLTPYGTNLGAPAITSNDVTAWKNTNINRVNHEFKTRYDALKAEYQKIMKEI